MTEREKYERWAKEVQPFVPPEFGWISWQASRKLALEEAAQLCEDYDACIVRARGGDNAVASKHKATAAEEIEDDIRALIYPSSKD